MKNFGIDRKVLSQGIHLCNIKALSHFVKKLWSRLSLLWTDGQTDRQGDSYIPPPPQTLFAGGIIMKAPSLMVQKLHRVRAITSYSLFRSGYNFTQLLSMTQGYVMTLTQGHISKSQCTYTGNLCPGHNSSLPSWIWIIFNTLIVYDRRMCHDLDPRSYLQSSWS